MHFYFTSDFLTSRNRLGPCNNMQNNHIYNDVNLKSSKKLFKSCRGPQRGRKTPNEAAFPARPAPKGSFSCLT